MAMGHGGLLLMILIKMELMTFSYPSLFLNLSEVIGTHVGQIKFLFQIRIATGNNLNILDI